MTWVTIVSALFLIAMLMMIFPGMRRAMKNPRKGTNSEWMGFALIIGAVGLFVFLLIKMV